jgi:RsiW-degrading membrane proteinase PrsW (M82 family)
MAPSLRKSGVSIAVDTALIIVLVVAVLTHLGLLARMSADVAGVFFRALAISTLLSAVPLLVLWFLDRRERETPMLMAAAFLWGGCIATALVLPFNAAFFHLVDQWVALHPTVTEILGPNATILIAAPLSAPIFEEAAKAAGVVLIFWLLRDEFDNMRDGFVYGALVGIGFNWFEAALYVAQAYVAHGVAPYGMQLGLRYALFGLGGHAMFTGLFGLFLGLAVQTRRLWLRLLAPVVGLTLAVAAHMFNNALPLFAALAGAAEGQPPGREPVFEGEPLSDVGFLTAFVNGSIVQLVIFVPFVLIVAIALWRSGVWERRVIREELASEVGRSVTPGEYQAVLADRILRTRRIDAMHPVRSAALVNAQHELAFRKRRVRDQGNDPELDPIVAGWREDILRQRQAA